MAQVGRQKRKPLQAMLKLYRNTLLVTANNLTLNAFDFQQATFSLQNNIYFASF
jgi:hypothetical protein